MNHLTLFCRSNVSSNGSTPKDHSSYYKVAGVAIGCILALGGLFLLLASQQALPRSIPNFMHGWSIPGTICGSIMLGGAPFLVTLPFFLPRHKKIEPQAEITPESEKTPKLTDSILFDGPLMDLESIMLQSAKKANVDGCKYEHIMLAYVARGRSFNLIAEDGSKTRFNEHWKTNGFPDIEKAKKCILITLEINPSSSWVFGTENLNSLLLTSTSSAQFIANGGVWYHLRYQERNKTTICSDVIELIKQGSDSDRKAWERDQQIIDVIAAKNSSSYAREIQDQHRSLLQA